MLIVDPVFEKTQNSRFPSGVSSLCAALRSAPRLPSVRLVLLAHRTLWPPARLPCWHVRRLLHLLLLPLRVLLLHGSHVVAVPVEVPASLRLCWRLLAESQGIFIFVAA